MGWRYWRIVCPLIGERHWKEFDGVERFFLKLIDPEAKGFKTLENYQNFAKASSAGSLPWRAGVPTLLMGFKPPGRGFESPGGLGGGQTISSVTRAAGCKVWGRRWFPLRFFSTRGPKCLENVRQSGPRCPSHFR
jgi:hypothetical protein